MNRGLPIGDESAVTVEGGVGVGVGGGGGAAAAIVSEIEKQKEASSPIEGN